MALGYGNLHYYTKYNGKKRVLIVDEKPNFAHSSIFNIGSEDNPLKWFDEFIEEIPITGLIYVTTTPEKSKQRVDLRARMGESIPLSYLQRCHNYHESWIKNIKKQVCLFNGNVDFKDNLDYLAKDLVTGFIIRHISPENNPHMYTMCSC